MYIFCCNSCIDSKTCNYAVPVSYASLKEKLMLILKRWLYWIYSLCLPLLHPMILHPHRGSWCPIVCSPSGAFIIFQNICITRAVCSLMSTLTYPWWYMRFTSDKIATWNIPKDLSWYCRYSQGINLVSLFYLECSTTTCGWRYMYVPICCLIG